MKTFLTINLVFLLMSCRTTADYDACREETTSVVFNPIVLPVDSGEVKAKIITPAIGVFALSNLSVKTTERMDMSISLDSAGNIAVKSATRPDTIEGRKETTSVRTETQRDRDNSNLLYVFIVLWTLSVFAVVRRK